MAWPVRQAEGRAEVQEEFYEAPLTWAAVPQMGLRFVIIGAGSLAVGEPLLSALGL